MSEDYYYWEFVTKDHIEEVESLKSQIASLKAENCYLKQELSRIKQKQTQEDDIPEDTIYPSGFSEADFRDAEFAGGRPLPRY